MKITLREAADHADWDKFCEITGFGYWCLNEGADPDTEVEITYEQAKEIGFL